MSALADALDKRVEKVADALLHRFGCTSRGKRGVPGSRRSVDWGGVGLGGGTVGRGLGGAC